MSNPNVRENQLSTLVAATVVPSSSTKMATIDVRGMTSLFVILTASIAALTACLVKAAASPGGTAVTVATSGTDYTTPNSIMKRASGDPSTLSASSAWVHLDVTGMAEVQIWATSGGTAKLAVQAGGQ